MAADDFTLESSELESGILVGADPVDRVEPSLDPSDDDVSAVDQDFEWLAVDDVVRRGDPTIHPVYTVNRFVVSR